MSHIDKSLLTAPNVRRQQPFLRSDVAGAQGPQELRGESIGTRSVVWPRRFNVRCGSARVFERGELSMITVEAPFSSVANVVWYALLRRGRAKPGLL